MGRHRAPEIRALERIDVLSRSNIDTALNIGGRCIEQWGLQRIVRDCFPIREHVGWIECAFRPVPIRDGDLDWNDVGRDGRACIR
jgi:hypothetical protein